MKRDYIKGKTPEEKLISANRLFQYVMPRLGRRTTGVIPPTLLFETVDKIPESGIVFSKLFPVSGTITKVIMNVGRVEAKTPIAGELTVSNQNLSRTFKFSTDRKYVDIRPNLSIMSGDLLILTVNDKEKFSDIHIGATFDMDVNEIQNKIFLEDTTDALKVGEAEEIDVDSGTSAR